VDDLLEGINRLMESNVTEPVNIGNPEEVTIKEFAEEIIKLTKSKSTLEPKPLPKDDPVRRRPDITRARTLLNWEPKIHRKEGLTRTIKDFKQRMDREPA